MLAARAGGDECGLVAAGRHQVPQERGVPGRDRVGERAGGGDRLGASLGGGGRHQDEELPVRHA